MKRILKHEPTSSYYYLVGCITEYMIRSDENNPHVHGGYVEETMYYGCSTRKTLCEEKFLVKKDLFQSVNMKYFGRHKVRKHKEIKGSDKCGTLNISEKFDSLKKMETTFSESKRKLGRSGKGLVTALDLNTKAM